MHTIFYATNLCGEMIILFVLNACPTLVLLNQFKCMGRNCLLCRSARIKRKMKSVWNKKWYCKQLLHCCILILLLIYLPYSSPSICNLEPASDWTDRAHPPYTPELLWEPEANTILNGIRMYGRYCTPLWGPNHTRNRKWYIV